MPKTYWFLTSIFSRLGLDFGRFWDPKMEPRWLFWRQKALWVALLNLLKLSVCSKWRLGALQARFWRPQASILEAKGSIFSRFSHDFGRVCRELAKNLPRTCRGTRCLPRSIIFGGLSTSAENFRGGVGRRWSPPGGFNKLSNRPN